MHWQSEAMQSQTVLRRLFRGIRRVSGFASPFLSHPLTSLFADWPTVILLIPRAGLSLAILLLFGTKAYGSPNVPASDRDSAYFHLNGTLTGFAMGVLLT